MLAEFERSEANPSIKPDLNKTPHLNSWDEYNAHVCMHCEQVLGASELDRSPSFGSETTTVSITMDLIDRNLRSGANSGCLRSIVIMGCLEWATLRSGCWDDVVYLYNRHRSRSFTSRDWKLFLSIKNPQYQRKYVEVNIGNNSDEPLSKSTGSLKTLSQIKKWLEECMECGDRHRTCRSTEGNNIDHNAQVRFLDIRNNAIKLVDAPTTTRYACLSHCWGPPERMFKTTKYNIEEHRHGITLDRLPKTFQDAIQVCRHVAIDYIWIDSICIIQDDDDDWKFQASQMSTIYEGAVLTIAASKASNPHDGLFATRSDLYLDDILRGCSGVLIREKMSFPPSLRAEGPYNPPERNEWPLYYRGWCFQELELSPRIIHFGLEQVIWLCSTFEYREIAPNLPTLLSPRKAFTGVTAEVGADLWHRYLVMYTKLSLTYSKDKLPAIAAIAKKFQDLNPDRQYIAGLWTDTLMYDLLWYKMVPETKCYTPNELQTPSWSWASLPGEVEYQIGVLCQKRILPQLVRTKYTIDGPEFTGHIREAFITLQAPVISLDDLISSEEMRNETWNNLSKYIQNNVSPDFSGFRKPFCEFPLHLIGHSIFWDTSTDKEEYDRRRDFASNLLVVFLMITSSQLSCLLVKRGVEAGTYVRVGCAYFYRRLFCEGFDGETHIDKGFLQAKRNFVDDIWNAIKDTEKREIILV